MWWLVLVLTILFLWLLIIRRKDRPEKFVPSPELVDHQQRLYELLKVFDEVTREYGLTYWASDGTLLGAVRHTSIIPWDDDIDVHAPTKTIQVLQDHIEDIRARGYDFVLADHIWRFRRYQDSSSRAAYIDVFEVTEKADRFVYVDKFNSERWPNSYFLIEEVFPLQTYEFGKMTIVGPSVAEPYLTRMYGDWRTPKIEGGHFDYI